MHNAFLKFAKLSMFRLLQSVSHLFLESLHKRIATAFHCSAFYLAKDVVSTLFSEILFVCPNAQTIEVSILESFSNLQDSIGAFQSLDM